MKVALVSEHASPLATLGGVDAGGQNVHVAALAMGLARLGAEVVVHTRRDDPALPRSVTMAPGVVVDHVRAGPAQPIPKDDLLPFMDRFADELSAVWERDRPDVVHAHFWMSGYAALPAARRLGIPVVQTFHALGVVKRRHQGDKDTSPAARTAIESAIVRDVDRIVATCSDEVFELVRLGADLRRVRVVPCGVDLEVFTPYGPAERRIPGLHRIVVVSRLVERKGLGNVITALGTLPDTELVVAGGPARAQLLQDAEARRLVDLAEQRGVASRVDLRGRLERWELPPLLRSADVVVCAPWYEPFGIVPLEAMACGTPVVATAVGGLVDSVVHGVTGLHVPPRQPEELAEAIRLLLDDEGLRRALGSAGVQRARTRYSWSRIAASTIEAYADLVRPTGIKAGEVQG